MENEPQSPPTKTPLRWYQYRLRTLLIVMTVLAAWMAFVSHRARQQKLAVDRIKALGGTLWYDYQKLKGKPWNHSDDKIPPPGPAWLRNFIGEDYFQTVVTVDLSKAAVTDDDLAVLENLTELEGLYLTDPNITGKGFAHLKTLKKLKGLGLWNTSIDDAGLANLEGLANLRQLCLDGTKITDAGTVHLQDLTQLEDWLGLTDTPITDRSLQYFKNFKKLQNLNLLRTNVTERGVRELKKALPNTIISYPRNGEDQAL
ncbi:MAG: hypothetical protein IT426_02550 [Pirellulales bacterium]|nr:hypothetical protein [Pirellulales bacterium]